MNLYFEVVIHMRKVALVDSLESTFGGCIWRERITDYGTNLLYLEATLANM